MIMKMHSYISTNGQLVYTNKQAERVLSELKKATEAYWAGKISADDLTKVALEVKKTNWNSLKERGVELIPRFVFCDHHARI